MSSRAGRQQRQHKLRIAFIGSGRIHIIEPYLRYFADRGHEVCLVSYDSFDRRRSAAYPIIDISFGASAREKNTKWRYILAGLKARRVLRQLNPDIVHGHFATSSGVICLLSGFRPYLVSVHGSDLFRSMRSLLWRAILTRIFRSSSGVHTVSQELSDIVGTLGVPTDDVFTLTQGVDIELFQCCATPVAPLERPLRLLFTRTLAEVYDPLVIVRACRKLAEKGIAFELTFAATGPMEDPIRTMVERYGFQDRVHFLGGYSNQNLPAILHANDIYLSSSRWDGTSISLLEAMACGIFPVVSRIAANLAWLTDGRSALMFDPGDDEQLVVAIQRAAADDRLRSAAADENRRIVVEMGGREKNMEAMESAYYRILGVTEREDLDWHNQMRRGS